MKHMVIIDGSSMFRRGFSVAKKEQNQNGVEIGAADLFSKMMLKIMHQMRKGRIPPTNIAVFFDPPRENTWRRDIYPEYKANRDDYDPDYLSQLPIIREMLDEIGVKHATPEKHEADDIIAAYALDAHAQGFNIGIVTTDKDMMQIVKPGIMVFNPQSDKWFNSAGVEAKMGVPPSKIVDFLALTGDAGDGVPGAPKVGPVGAVKLLNEFKDLEEALNNTDAISSKISKKSLSENAEQIRMSKRLVTLDVEGCPREFSISDTSFPDPFEAGKKVEEWANLVLPFLEPEEEAHSPSP